MEGEAEAMNSLQQSLLHAVIYLRDRPLSAHPSDLLEVTKSVVRAVQPKDELDANICGSLAARECARPCKALFCDLIDPKDLT